MSDAISKKGTYDLSNLFVLPTQKKRKGIDRPGKRGREEEENREVLNTQERLEVMKNFSKSNKLSENGKELRQESITSKQNEVVEKRPLLSQTPSTVVDNHIETSLSGHSNPAMSKEEILLAIRGQLSNLREKSQRIKFFVEEMVNSCPIDEKEE